MDAVIDRVAGGRKGMVEGYGRVWRVKYLDSTGVSGSGSYQVDLGGDHREVIEAVAGWYLSSGQSVTIEEL